MIRVCTTKARALSFLSLVADLHFCTVAILAEGINLVVAILQAFLSAGSIPHKKEKGWRGCTVPVHTHTSVHAHRRTGVRTHLRAGLCAHVLCLCACLCVWWKSLPLALNYNLKMHC